MPIFVLAPTVFIVLTIGAVTGALTDNINKPIDLSKLKTGQAIYKVNE